MLKKACRIIYKAFGSFLERCLSTYNNRIPSTTVNTHLSEQNRRSSLSWIDRKERYVLRHTIFIFILLKLAIKISSILSHLSSPFSTRIIVTKHYYAARK
jgi:hypothetical protein